jgi:endogenous inhibitor of DNA gyrase (YacG/DUF329 family)
MVDFGRWLAEDYRISEPLDYEELAEFQNTNRDSHEEAE